MSSVTPTAVADVLLGSSWAQAPRELVAADISHLAFRVAMALQLARSPAGETAFPSFASLSRTCHCSATAAKKAVAELRTAGILQDVEIRDEASLLARRESRLVMPRSRALADARVRSGVAVVGSTCTAPLRSAPSPLRSDGISKSGATSSTAAEKRSNHEEGARHAMWDALEDELGAARTDTEKTLRGKVVRELLDAGVESQQVAVVCAAYRNEWPTVTLTGTALLKWWSTFERKRKLTVTERLAEMERRRVESIADDGA